MRLQAAGVGESRGDAAMYFHIAGVIVGVEIGRDSLGAGTEGKELGPLGQAAVVGADHTFVVTFIINGLKVTGGVRALEKAVPFLPIAQQTPINTIVNRPAGGGPGSG